jgi:hypothetical protein
MVRVDAILQHVTMLDLIEDLAERKVDQLSYQGMRDLNSYCDDRWSLQLFPIGAELERAVRLIETRNIVVHNGAVMNRTFLSRLQDSPAKLGQRFEFDFDAVFYDLEFLAQSANSIDSR